MSLIDTFNHAHVAKLNGLPVYWPLVNIPAHRLLNGCKDENVLLTPGNLLLGGGSGETPALALNIYVVLTDFIERNIDYLGYMDKFKSEALKTDEEGNAWEIAKSIDNLNFFNFDNAVNASSENSLKDTLPFDMNDWSFEEFYTLYQFFKFRNPALKPSQLESTLLDTIAWFVIHNMPLDVCVFDEHLRYVAILLKKKNYGNLFSFDQDTNYFKEEEVNELISGVLMSQKFGKFSENGRTTWGFSLDDWYNKYGE